VIESEPPPALEGFWVRLQPLSEASPGEIAALDAAASWPTPMGGLVRRQVAVDGTADAMVIRDLSDAKAVGVITAREDEENPGTCTLSLFVNTAQSRAGWALEAFLLFALRQFDQGRHKLVFEVLSFNEPVLRLMGSLAWRRKPRCARTNTWRGGDGTCWSLA